MTIDLVHPVGPADPGRPPRLVLLPSLTDVAAQQAFLAERALLLRRAAASGDRLTTALYLILLDHDAVPGVAGLGSALCCVACAEPGGAGHLAYPCPTAERALCALAATLP